MLERFKKIVTLLALFTVLPILLFGQSFSVNSTRFVSCGGCNITVRHSIPTAGDGLLIIGNTDCVITGCDIPFHAPDSAGETSNLVVCRLDSAMNIVWVKVYGGSRMDIGISATQTTDKGFAVLGYTYSVDGDVTGNHSAGSGDLWLLRIDSNGTLLWQMCYGSTYDEQGISIANAADGGFVLMGMSNGMGDDVPTHYSGSQFDYDWFIVKTTNIGSVEWTKTLGGSREEYHYGTVLEDLGSIYIISSSTSTDHDCIDTAWHSGVETVFDYYILKLNAVGNVIWSRSFGGDFIDYATCAIWDSRDSSIIINGFTNSGNGYFVSGTIGGGDMLVLKIDKNGDWKWGKCIGSTKQEFGKGVCTSSDGYIVYGHTWPDTASLYGNWLSAIDFAGNIMSNRTFGGNGSDHACSVFPFKNGYAATGFTNSFNFSEGYNFGHSGALSGSAFVSSILFSPLTTAETQFNNPKISVFPNPSTNNTSIILPQYSKGGIVRIQNYLGQTIYSRILIENEQNVFVRTAEWIPGLYFIAWIPETGITATARMIKL